VTVALTDVAITWLQTNWLPLAVVVAAAVVMIFGGWKLKLIALAILAVLLYIYGIPQIGVPPRFGMAIMKGAGA
jgi:hypothetical protein